MVVSALMAARVSLGDGDALHRVEVNGVEHLEGEGHGDGLPEERDGLHAEALSALEGDDVVRPFIGGNPHRRAGEGEAVDGLGGVVDREGVEPFGLRFFERAFVRLRLWRAVRDGPPLRYVPRLDLGVVAAREKIVEGVPGFWR